MKISQENPQALRNPWVLGLLAFLGVFLSANAVFIYLAFSSPPNLVVKDFYEKGQAYAETQERIARQQALGWSGMIMVPPESRVNQIQSYEAVITGKNSVGLALDSVKFYAYRPSDARADFSLDMKKYDQGRYIAEVSFSLPGTWDILVEAKRGEDEFIMTRRIRIEP